MELIKFNHTTKEERSQAVAELMDEVLNGRVNALDLHIRLKNIEEVIKNLSSMPAYKGILLDESEKYGKNFTRHNAAISIREVGVKYDFANHGNSRLRDLYILLAETHDKIKELETYHKGLPAAGIDVLDPVTGEVERHYPPTKTSTTSVAVTLK